MENALQVFSYEGTSIRTIEIDGEAWFVGKDVATVLGYGDTDQAVRDHVDSEDKLTRQFDGSGQKRNMTVINESGLYSLIFASKLPSAKQFKHWVTSEVLPQIRRTGHYSVGYEPQGIFVIDAAIRMLSLHGIKDNQLMLALDKVYKRCAGFSLLEVTGTQLEAPTTNALLTPTQIGEHFGLSARSVNEILEDTGYQQKVAGQWEALPLGADYAVMQDTGKAHSNGTPIRQLKWDSSILEVFDDLIEVAEERGLEF